MVNVTDLVLKLDQAVRWPAARRWLYETYGENAYLPLKVLYTDAVLEPWSQQFAEPWALVPFTIEQEDGACHSYFYLEFQDPDDEMIFRLKWL